MAPTGFSLYPTDPRKRICYFETPDKLKRKRKRSVKLRAQKRVTCPLFCVAEDILMDVIHECVDGVYQWWRRLFGSLRVKPESGTAPAASFVHVRNEAKFTTLISTSSFVTDGKSSSRSRAKWKHLFFENQLVLFDVKMLVVLTAVGSF